MSQDAPKTPWWNDRAIRAILYQILVVGAVVLAAWYLISNTLDNLAARNIATGFGFLTRESGFAIGESPIPFDPADSYAKAILVGLLNTVIVAVLGVILSTMIGTVIGVARLSGNWLVARLASFYVETLRNIPVLLQLLFWYALITEGLPGPNQALNPLPDVYLSNRGLKFPTPDWGGVEWLVLAALFLGMAGTFLLVRWAKRRQALTGKIFPTIRAGIGLILGLPLLAWIALGAPTQMNAPELQGFNFEGGHSVSPEFVALLTGLTLYTASFIAEIVRSGILAVAPGQTEAALALGLKRGQVLRLVVMPQALRVIIPPLTSQYLNLTKNSSLAVAIGYPDLVSVSNTTINQTGQAIEGVALLMAVYLAVSLAISAFMSWYDKKTALVGR
ncbi:MAG: amino acid ABC transporter permease [Alphaproteobacteria bacterium]|nr:amino acid ABC transporter permease [Alphaproteobacteria bacterium]